jgi:hypothetical protein
MVEFRSHLARVEVGEYRHLLGPVDCQDGRRCRRGPPVVVGRLAAVARRWPGQAKTVVWMAASCRRNSGADLAARPNLADHSCPDVWWGAGFPVVAVVDDLPFRDAVRLPRSRLVLSQVVYRDAR